MYVYKYTRMDVSCLCAHAFGRGCLLLRALWSPRCTHVVSLVALSPVLCVVLRAYKPFSSSARRDGVQFNHWVQANAEFVDYPFARFNKKVRGLCVCVCAGAASHHVTLLAPLFIPVSLLLYSS